MKINSKFRKNIDLDQNSSPYFHINNGFNQQMQAK